MKKLVMVLAIALIAAPVSANLLTDSWEVYDSTWGNGDPNDWTTLTATDAEISGGSGSDVAFQIVTAPSTETIEFTGDVSGGGGWIEIMLRVMPAGTVVGDLNPSGLYIDTSNVVFINKHEGPISGSIAIGGSGWSHTNGSNQLAVSAGDLVLVAVKSGNNTGTNFNNLNVTPEPASAMLLLGGLPLLLRRRRA